MISAAKRAETGRSTANEIVSESRRAFLKAAKKHKLTITKIARRLSEALDATETRVFKASEKELDEEGNVTAIKDYLIYSDPLIDNTTRLNAVKLAGEWFDLKPAEKHEIEINDLTDSIRAARDRVKSGKQRALKGKGEADK